MVVETYGKLLIVGKDGKSELEFPLDKQNILIGRQVGIRLLKPDYLTARPL